MPTVHEHLSEQFHKWENRGRGWTVYEEPVHPEPPFKPFAQKRMAQAVDDGLRPTFLSSLAKRFTGQKEVVMLVEPEEEPKPIPLSRSSLIEWQIALPEDLDIKPDVMDQFFRNLANCEEPIAFELLGTHGRVLSQFAAGAEDAALVRKQLQAHFPEVSFRQHESVLEKAWAECSDPLVVEFGLEREFMYSLATGKIDPFIGIIGALSELQAGEVAVFQVLFQHAGKPWPENIIRSVTHADGSPMFVNMPDLAKAAQNKINRPLYATVVRLGVSSADSDRSLQIACDVAASLRAFANPQGNELIPLDNSDYPFEEHIEDLILRQSRRTGMLLNSDELTGFVHLPSRQVRSTVFVRDIGRAKPAPAIIRGNRGVFLGNNLYGEESIPVRLTPEQRVQHMHVIGVQGTGKSTLLYRLIKADIENGEGLAVLDPHGDLIEQILGIIPAHRINDVVLVDPSDEEYSVGFNILSAHSDSEKRLLASDLVSVFQRLSTTWGDQMGSVLQNAILAFLESDQGGTLADLRRFLLEPAFRNKFLETVRDPNVVYYWQKGFTQLAGNKSIGSVITRLNDFLASKTIRYMVSQTDNRLDFGNILDTGKIFLAKLPQGQMGKENSFLLGSLLVSKIQQMVMARQAQRVTARKDFWLYIDEFHNFITPSMTEILTGARKYRLGLILAHQELRQLERDREVASAVLSMPYTRVAFRVGDADARALENGFSYFEARDLQNLGKGQAICRVEKADGDFNLAVPLPEFPDAAIAEATRQSVIAASRAKYATSRTDVEAAERAQYKSNSGDTLPPKRPPEPKVVGVQPPIEPKEQPDTDSADSQHSAIKKLIASEAETLDYTATFEESVLNGQGRVDVILRRGNQAVACEISVSNTVEYEINNIIKCCKAGFQRVVLISRNQNKLTNIKTGLSQRGEVLNLSEVSFCTPEELIAKLFDWANDSPQDGEIEKGKPKKRRFTFSSEELTESDRKRLEKNMLDSLKAAMKPKPDR